SFLRRIKHNQLVRACYVSGCKNPRNIDIAEKRSHIIRCRSGHNLAWRADLNDLAVLHNANPVANTHGFIKIMADEYNSAALLCLVASAHPAFPCGSKDQA